MDDTKPISIGSPSDSGYSAESNINAEAQLRELADYKFEEEPNWFNRILYFSAGVDNQLLKHCTNYDRVKAQGIGGIVLATATLAFFSGSYAFYIVFRGSQDDALPYVDILPSILFGIVWAAVIYNLDRFIVSAGGHGDGTDKITWGEFFRAIPRLIMAAVIGLVLSKPHEIKIMETEVETLLSEEREKVKKNLRAKEDEKHEQNKAEIEKRIERLKSDVAEEESKVESKRNERDRIQKEYEDQIAGRKGQQAGVGEKARALKESLDQATTEYDREYKKIEPRVSELKSEIDKASNVEMGALVQKRTQSLQEADKKGDAYGGLIVRIELAHQKFPLASALITLLLIIIEVSPIFFKMMLSLSPIDYLTENQKRVAVAMRGIQLDHRFAVNASSDGISDLKTASYHRAKVVEEMAAGSLKTQAELTRIANETYMAKTAEEIKADIERFISKDNKS